MNDGERIKVVGRRSRLDVSSPADCCRRAALLQASADQLNPHPRPRGFIFKARSWEDYEHWRKSQSNPRLW